MDEEGSRRIGALAERLRPMVARLEASGATAADYVREIDKLAGMLGEEPLPGMHLAIGLALLRAGANRGLVDEALRSQGHLPRRTPHACCGPEEEEA